MLIAIDQAFYLAVAVVMSRTPWWGERQVRAGSGSERYRALSVTRAQGLRDAGALKEVPKD